MAAAGLDCGGLLAEGDFSFESGVRAARTLLAGPDPATAIIASNDRMALACLEIAREQGLGVPDDVSLVSFDNTPIVRFAQPPLTAIDQPVAETTSRAVELIIAVQRGGPLPEAPVIVPAQLVERQSTARPRAALIRASCGFSRSPGRAAQSPTSPCSPSSCRSGSRTMAGPDSVRWLAYITFCGAVAASVGNILFGMASDRTRMRRPWIAAGLGAVRRAASGDDARAEHPIVLLVLVVLWQLALNMMLGPLSAWAADSVPASQLGRLGGLLAFAPAMGALAGVWSRCPTSPARIGGSCSSACWSPLALRR